MAVLRLGSTVTVKHWDVTKKGNGEQGTRKGGWENEKCEQNRDFEGLKLGFVPITFNPPPAPPQKKIPESNN